MPATLVASVASQTDYPEKDLNTLALSGNPIHVEDVLGKSGNAGMAADYNEATYTDAGVVVFNEGCISEEKTQQVGLAGPNHIYWGYEWKLDNLREDGLSGGRIHVSEAKLSSLVGTFEGEGYARLVEGVAFSAAR